MSRVSSVGTARVCLGAIGLFMLPAGVQAAFAPRSFFDDFPLGRGWIADEGGSYDGLAGLDHVGLVVSPAVIPALAALVLGIVATSPKRPVS